MGVLGEAVFSCHCLSEARWGRQPHACLWCHQLQFFGVYGPQGRRWTQSPPQLHAVCTFWPFSSGEAAGLLQTEAAWRQMCSVRLGSWRTGSRPPCQIKNNTRTLTWSWIHAISVMTCKVRQATQTPGEFKCFHSSRKLLKSHSLCVSVETSYCI